MKKHFFFLQNHPTSLASLSDQWYVKDATGEWVAKEADIPGNASGEQVAEAVERHEAEMAELKKAGLAKHRHEGLKLGLNSTAAEQNEHKVKVFVGGRERVIYIHGNPMAAQALNGMTNPDAHAGPFEKFVKRLNSARAALVTSLSPVFVLSNLAMDSLQAASYTLVREDAAYNRQAMKNARLVFTQKEAWLPTLLNKWRKGTLDTKGSEVERYFDEFMRNGGETGFTDLWTVEKVKKDIGRFVKDAEGGAGRWPLKTWRSLLDGVTLLNRAAEDTSRFVCYMTSRQQGRDVAQSIWDAKEVTVNFNKKGDGGFLTRQLNCAYMFFNAAVQSVAGFGRLVANNPKRSAALASAYTVAGCAAPLLVFLMALFSQWVAALLGLGGDGDDGEEKDPMQWYWDLPEWQRRNNLVLYIPFTGKSYFLIPLPHELRPFYGMGECALSFLCGKSTAEDALGDAVLGFSAMLPLDFTGNGGDPRLNLTPSLAQPVAQVALNKDYFGRPIYRDSEHSEHDPEWTKSYKGTSAVAIGLSKFINSIGNADPDVHKQPWDGPWSNPDVMEHVVTEYAGGLGKLALQVGKLATMPWDEDARQWRNVPVLSRFVATVDERSAGSLVNSRYHEAMDEYRQTEHDYLKYREKARNGEEGYAKRLEAFQGTPVYARYLALEGYEDAIGRLRSELKKAQSPEDGKLFEEVIQQLKGHAVATLEREAEKGYPRKPEGKGGYMLAEVEAGLYGINYFLNGLNRARSHNDKGRNDDNVEKARRMLMHQLEAFKGIAVAQNDGKTAGKEAD